MSNSGDHISSSAPTHEEPLKNWSTPVLQPLGGAPAVTDNGGSGSDISASES